MHQRHNIRHNVHQAQMMRPPHIPPQMNVNRAPHPQQVSIQQTPPQIPKQQQQTQQNQQHTTNMAMGTGPQVLSQYVPTSHQRGGDLNRLAHHLPPALQQQQKQPPPPVSQINLQQPQLNQPPQRISPQMHQPHYMKTRPPNINNNSHGGVNVNTLQQQHAQLQPPPPPPPPTTSNINNQQLQHQSHHQKIPPIHQHQPQQQTQHQLQQQHNNNNYIPKIHLAVNHQNPKCNNNVTAGSGGTYSKINQTKHSQQSLQIVSQSHHPQQNQSQVVSSKIQSQQPSQIQSVPSQQHKIQQPQHLNQSNLQATTSQIQNSQPKLIQNSNKASNLAILSDSTCSSVTTIQKSTTVSAPNSGNLINTQIISNNIIPTVVPPVKQKILKNISPNTINATEPTPSHKISKKPTSLNVTSTEPVTNVEPSENIALEPASKETYGIPSTDNISSGKEKTPMCLVNELARYNQIQHQYRLTGEQGPAHSKRFTVILKLGDEEYAAEGLSIKKAQHTAAAEAITKTKYDHPPPKKIRHKNGSGRFGIGNITPTVELNALAMKIGEKVVYVFDSPMSSQTSAGHMSQLQLMSSTNQTNVSNNLPLNPNQPIAPNSNNSAMPPATLSNGPPSPNYYCDNNYQYGQFNSRNNLVNIYLNGNGMRFPNLTRRPYARGGFIKFRSRMMTPFHGIHPGFSRDACKITLLVGKEKFTGVGPTVQAAKHDAASKALEVLKPAAENSENTEDLNISTGESESEIKSPISLVYEIGLKRNLLVTFEVKSEVGPPHLKNFITICKVGDIITEGEGNGKKISKKRAAKNMLDELKQLPPLSPEKPQAATTYHNNNNKSPPKVNRVNKRNMTGNTVQQGPPQQLASTKKRSKNVIKDNAETENSEEINPISRLIQIQQASKEREPVYTVVDETGAPRRREFTIEVTVNGQSAKGIGSNKKIAKKNAAKNLLMVLGYELNSSNKENNLNIVNTAENNCKVKSSEKDVKSSEKDSSQCTNNSNNSSKTNQQAQSGCSSRQIVPGLIHLPQNNKDEMVNKTSAVVGTQSQQNLKTNESKTQQNSTNEGTVKKNECNEKTNVESVRRTTDFGVRPKDQLLYLAQLLGFEANFTDYPKGNHGEYLTIVALFTDPPQLCHGAGEDTDSSQDNAALAALQMLSKLGLDNVKPKKPKSNPSSSSNNSTDDKSVVPSTEIAKN